MLFQLRMTPLLMGRVIDHDQGGNLFTHMQLILWADKGLKLSTMTKKNHLGGAGVGMWPKEKDVYYGDFTLHWNTSIQFMALNSESIFLPVKTLGGNKSWLKNLSCCHHCERSELNPWPQASASWLLQTFERLSLK